MFFIFFEQENLFQRFSFKSKIIKDFLRFKVSTEPLQLIKGKLNMNLKF